MKWWVHRLKHLSIWKKQKKTGGKQTSLKLPKCFSPFLLGHLNVKVNLKKAQGEKRVFKCVYRKKVSLTLNNRNRTMKNRTSYDWRKLHVVGCQRMRMKLTSQEGRSPLCAGNRIFSYFIGEVWVFGKVRRACIFVARDIWLANSTRMFIRNICSWCYFQTSQWEWPNLFIPLSACQWFGNSKW